jgi:hypothetical protein
MLDVVAGFLPSELNYGRVSAPSEARFDEKTHRDHISTAQRRLFRYSSTDLRLGESSIAVNVPSQDCSLDGLIKKAGMESRVSQLECSSSKARHVPSSCQER